MRVASSLGCMYLWRIVCWSIIRVARELWHFIARAGMRGPPGHLDAIVGVAATVVCGKVRVELGAGAACGGTTRSTGRRGAAEEQVWGDKVFGHGRQGKRLDGGRERRDRVTSVVPVAAAAVAAAVHCVAPVEPGNMDVAIETDVAVAACPTERRREVWRGKGADERWTLLHRRGIVIVHLCLCSAPALFCREESCWLAGRRGCGM